MHARCMYVGPKTRAYVAHDRELKIQVDFSQFCSELDDWQVDLGRLVHLQVKQTKRREK
jgi:hypothetical protein